LNSIFDSRGVTFALSFFFALILWLYVRGEFRVREELQVGLNYIKSEKYVAVGERPENIKVVLRGPAEDLRTLTQKKRTIDIDLKYFLIGSQVAGDFESKLRKELPPQVEIVSIKPREIRFQVDEYMKKTLALGVDLRGKVAEGYQVGEVEILPPKLTIAGAKSLIKDMEKIQVAAIELEQTQKTITKDFEYTPENADLWIVGESQVRVIAEVKEKIIQKTFEVPISMVNSNFKYSISPQNIQLVVEGPYGKIQSIKTKDFLAFVDGEELRTGYYRKPIAIKPPESVKLVDNEPRYFSIRLWR